MASQLNNTDGSYYYYEDSEIVSLEAQSKFPHFTKLDTYKLIVLGSLLSIGIPLNIFVFMSVINQMRNLMSRLVLLQLNLCIAGLLVLLFFALPQIVWICTLEFEGGVFSCKFLKFSSLFSLYLSSNSVACISVDRMMTVLRPFSSCTGSTKVVKWLVGTSWLCAFVCSLPQMYFWTTYTATLDNGNFTYCTNIYRIAEVEIGEISQWDRDFWLSYTCFHLVMVFWVPLMIVVLSYTVILRILAQRFQFLTKLSFKSQMKPSESDGLVSEQSGIPANNHHSAKAKKMTAVIVLMYIGCWLPYNLINVWALFDPTSNALHITNLLYDLIIVNSVANSFIYYNVGMSKLCRLCGKSTPNH